MSITEVAPATVSTSSTVASNVRAESARLGYSQSDLGRMLGFTQSQINRRWRGLIPWQLDELDTVSVLLGVSVRDLVTPPRGGTRSINAGLPGQLPRLDSNQQPADYSFFLISWVLGA